MIYVFFTYIQKGATKKKETRYKKPTIHPALKGPLDHDITTNSKDVFFFQSKSGLHFCWGPEILGSNGKKSGTP